VVVDALINSDGNVTGVKVISGPALLQQAAVESLLQWKYEPARLDRQPVAMHLTVTIKFQIH
jgi:TonB family protein